MIHYVRQGDPKGLGHAVLCAAPHVGNEPFAVLLGDDLIDPRDPLLQRMIEVQEQYGGSVIALMEVAPEQIHLYGCAAVRAPRTATSSRSADWSKPDAADAPSNYAIIGRYVLDPTSSTYSARPSPAARGRSS